MSTGVYVYDARALRYLPDGPCQFPELVLRLLAAGERVAAWETDAEWFDIGTVGEYERAAADVERSPERYDMDPLRSATARGAPRARAGKRQRAAG